MPSGSHRSRGGSHFGGGGSRSSSRGFSSGGRSSRGFSGGSHFGGPIRHHHFGPRRIWLGPRRYYYIGGNSSFAVVAVLLFFAFVFSLVFGSSYSYNKNQIELVKEDYVYYQEMIDFAKSNTEYIIDAEVTGKFYNNYAEKYYITYKIDFGGYLPLNGETYSTYTLTETGKYKIGDTIKVAVDSIPVNSDTDSIPMDYDGINLEKNGEYVNLKKDARRNLVLLIITILITIIIFAFIIKHMLKNSRVEEEEKNENKVETKEVTTVTCKYCGGVHDKGKSKCPNCGASLRN